MPITHHHYEKPFRQWLDDIKAKTVVQTPAQVTLMGGHNYFDGGSAVSLIVNRYLTVKSVWSNNEPPLSSLADPDGGIVLVSSHFEETISLSWMDLHEIRSKDSKLEMPNIPSKDHWSYLVVGLLVEILQQDTREFFFTAGKWLLLQIDSNIPVGQGFGSAVAFLTSVAISFSHAIDLQFSNLQIAKIVQNTEHKYRLKTLEIYTPLVAMHGLPGRFLKVDCSTLKSTYPESFVHIKPSSRLGNFKLILLDTGKVWPLTAKRSETHYSKNPFRESLQENLRVLKFCKGMEKGDLSIATTEMLNSQKSLNKLYGSWYTPLKKLNQSIIEVNNTLPPSQRIVGSRVSNLAGSGSLVQFVPKSQVDFFLDYILAPGTRFHSFAGRAPRAFTLEFGEEFRLFHEKSSFFANQSDLS